jgi:para-nitrobenzyl esterase
VIEVSCFGSGSSGVTDFQETKMRAALLLVLVLSAAPAVAQQGAPIAAAAPAAVYSSSSTPIGTLLDDADAKAVLDMDVPGLTTNPQIEMARGMTLKDIQSYAADQLTDDVLKKIDTHLATIAKK